jgi:hypothetical protein
MGRVAAVADVGLGTPQQQRDAYRHAAPLAFPAALFPNHSGAPDGSSMSIDGDGAAVTILEARREILTLEILADHASLTPVAAWRVSLALAAIRAALDLQRKNSRLPQQREAA